MGLVGALFADRRAQEPTVDWINNGDAMIIMMTSTPTIDEGE